MTYKEILDQIGEAAALEQTAEECAELAHACLKMGTEVQGGESDAGSGRRNKRTDT